MSTLFQRLLEICRDQGIEHPRNRDIQDLVGITSGRVTQIKQEGEAASLSEDKMARLAAHAQDVGSGAVRDRAWNPLLRVSWREVMDDRRPRPGLYPRE